MWPSRCRAVLPVPVTLGHAPHPFLWVQRLRRNVLSSGSGYQFLCPSVTPLTSFVDLIHVAISLSGCVTSSCDPRSCSSPLSVGSAPSSERPLFWLGLPVPVSLGHAAHLPSVSKLTVHSPEGPPITKL